MPVSHWSPSLEFRTWLFSCCPCVLLGFLLAVVRPRGAPDKWSRFRVVSLKVGSVAFVSSLSGIHTFEQLRRTTLRCYLTPSPNLSRFLDPCTQRVWAEDFTSDYFDSQFHGRTTHMPSLVMPVSFYNFSSSRKVHALGLWLACREVSPRLSSATAATLGFLGLGWFDLPPGNLNYFLWIVLTRISFCQCFHPWFVSLHLVHCPFCFLFVDYFLVDTGVCVGPNSMHNFQPGRRLPFVNLLLIFLRLVYPFLFSGILRFFRCLCSCWLVMFPFPTWVRPRNIIVLKPFSFLEIFFIADRLSESFYPILVFRVFLMHWHSPYSLMQYLVPD